MGLLRSPIIPHSYFLTFTLNSLSPIKLTNACICNSVQSMIDLDDLYPALPEELALTSPPPHLPRSPTLSHVHLHPSQSPAHEYECPTHTADELRNSSTRLCRMESHGKGNFQLYDTIMAEQITSHVNEYNRFKEANQLTSRL